MRTVYDLLCGCGRRNRVLNLYTEVKCDRCRWLLVYATGKPQQWALTTPVHVQRLAPDMRLKKNRRRSTSAPTKGEP